MEGRELWDRGIQHTMRKRMVVGLELRLLGRFQIVNITKTTISRLFDNMPSRCIDIRLMDKLSYKQGASSTAVQASTCWLACRISDIISRDPIPLYLAIWDC